MDSWSYNKGATFNIDLKFVINQVKYLIIVASWLKLGED